MFTFLQVCQAVAVESSANDPAYDQAQRRHPSQQRHCKCRCDAVGDASRILRAREPASLDRLSLYTSGCELGTLGISRCLPLETADWLGFALAPTAFELLDERTLGNELPR
eukprot:CAMPEP_0180022866 /NCGR_PEP_ID=MMETSP0984-20121128/23108_1 /TAXON_ID=483367 /ORGANISM="non described non described, Strain CCMP 2436" /LENGTH=110 /DNA_ID=CAMNT_0021946975 /DNA_START=96 /DNA_END=428 /DNA_ORIENTATION=+